MSGRVLLGWSSGSPVTRVPLSVPGDSHIITCAEPGKGKSRSVGLPNLIRYTGSMVVLDLNNELTKAAALWRAAVLGQDVRVFDPFHIVDPSWLPLVDGEPCYAKADPLDFVRASSHPHSAAFKLAETYIPPDTMKESHWAEGARGYMVAKMKFVALDPLFEGLDLPRTMLSVWLLLSDPELNKASLRLMALSEDSFVADQATAFLKAGKDNREMQGIRNQIRVACGKMFGEGAILDTMTSTNVDFVQLRKRPMTIFLPLPGDLVPTHSKYLNGLIAIMLSTIEQDGRRPYDPQGPPPVVFQCDEFAALGRFKLIADGLARFRGFGIKFHLLLQNLSQGKDSYKDGWGSIMGNCPITQFFGGTNDLYTAETISKLAGTGTYVKEGKNENGQPGNQGGTSWNTYARPLYTPDEIMRLPMPRQLILRSGQKPVEGYLFHPSLCEFPDYGAFMYCLEQGWSLNVAVQAATKAPATRNPDQVSGKAG